MPEFTDKYHPRFKRDLRKIDKAVESEVKDHHIPRILHDPYLADELTGDLAGISSYHLKKGKVQYRISYIVDEEQKIVYIPSPSPPEDLSASGGLCALTIQAPEFYCNNKNSVIREIRAKKIK